MINMFFKIVIYLSMMIKNDRWYSSTLFLLLCSTYINALQWWGIADSPLLFCQSPIGPAVLPGWWLDLLDLFKWKVALRHHPRRLRLLCHDPALVAVSNSQILFWNHLYSKQKIFLSLPVSSDSTTDINIVKVLF